MDLYDVIFEGEILPGKNINTVKSAFARLFKISSQKKLESYFSGHACVIKKSISLEQAHKYEQALLGIGAYCQQKLIAKKAAVESIDFEATQISTDEAGEKDEAAASVDNSSEDESTEEASAAIDFEYNVTDTPEPISQAEIVQADSTIEDSSEEPDEERPAEENLEAIEFEYGSVEETQVETEEQLVEVEQALDKDSEPDDEQDDDEDSGIIEFEYTEIGSTVTPAAEANASEQEVSAIATGGSVSLTDLSLVPLEENDSDEEDEAEEK